MTYRGRARVGLFAAMAVVAGCSSQKPGGEPADSGNRGDTATSGGDAGGDTGVEGGREGGPEGSSPDAPSGIAPPLKLPPPVADITWAATTTLIDSSHLSLVKSVDTTTGVITLDSKGVKSAALDLSSGRIVVIYGQVMRSITSTMDDGTTLTLQTGTTSLAQAATHAELDWQQATELSPAAAMLAMTSKHHRILHMNPMITGNMLSYEGELGEYKYTIEMTLMGGSADVTVSIEKDIASHITAKFSAKGTLSRFVDHHHVVVSGGALQQYESDNNNVKGSLTLTAVATASGMDAVTWELPVPLFKYIIPVGPIPIELEIGAEFTLNADVPAESSVNASGVIDFDSDLGFTYSGSWGATGRIGPYMFSKGTVEEAASPSADEFSGGIGFPRLSVSMFGESLLGWIQTGFVLGGGYTFFPACLQTKATYLASYGWDVSVLDTSVASGSDNLFEKVEVLEQTAGCPDAGGGG